MKLIDDAYKTAIQVLDKCARPTGFYASGLRGGYEATWSRDSMITSLGASLVGGRYKLPFVRSLDLLKKWQSENGQIPNCVGSYNIDRHSTKTYNTIDSSLWYIIGHYVYAQAYGIDKIFEQHRNSLARAFVWLKYQDPNEDGLLSQQPTMDWQDAFPHKYGNVINTQALYYGALRLAGGKKGEKRAEHIKKVVNGDIEAYLSLYDPKLGYYLPWNWKNHDGDREQEEWFDSLGNLLAIVFGLAKQEIAESILDHIKKEKIDKPYPVKAIWPPIKPGDKEWHSYFDKCNARTPLNYLNGGVWPFIGGFYVAALTKMNRHDEAAKALLSLAQGGLKRLRVRDHKEHYEFNEWLHGKTGHAMGEPYQGWTAGAYIYAYHCVKEKKAIYFE